MSWTEDQQKAIVSCISELEAESRNGESRLSPRMLMRLTYLRYRVGLVEYAPLIAEAEATLYPAPLTPP